MKLDLEDGFQRHPYRLLDDLVAQAGDGCRELHITPARSWVRRPLPIRVIHCEANSFRFSKRVASAESIR